MNREIDFSPEERREIMFNKEQYPGLSALIRARNKYDKEVSKSADNETNEG